ncbi:MAG: sugar ABC transporter substrate-binding protein [Anaerolineales bacterium]
MIKKTILFLAIALTLAVGLAACGSTPTEPAGEEVSEPAGEAEEPVEEPAVEDKPNKIAYLAQSAFANDFTLVEYYGVVDSIEAAGYEAVVYNPDFDAAEQINMMEDALAEGGLAGIIIHPIDSALIVNAIEKANEAGIPVVNVVAGSTGGDVLVTVRNNTLAEGSNACEVIVQELEARYGEVKGKVLEVHGGLQDDVAKGRSQGYRDCIAAYPGVETILTEATGWSLTLAESGTRDMLTANPDIDAIFSHADYFNDSIEAGLVAANKLIASPDPAHVIWTSVDGAPHALDRIRNGIMDQTSANPNYAYGEWAVKFLVDFIDNGNRPVVGTVYEEAGTAWSPAEVVEGAAGPEMVMTPFNVTLATVDSNVLWGNQIWEKPE